MKNPNIAITDLAEAFIIHLDGIFWNGYAEQLANDNPELYNFEYDQFFNYYA